jgi:DNA-binding transcriptional MocR family regulator
MLAFFDIGDALAVDEFTYGNLIEAARFVRIRLVPIEGDGEGMSPTALKKAAAHSRIKGVFLMPSCANPTTVTMSSRRKDELSEVIAECGMFVLEDDATLQSDGSGTFLGRLPEQTFYLTGATRFLAPGLRVAFAVTSRRHLPVLMNAHHRLTIKASALDTEIMSELILSGRAEKLIDQKIRRAKEMNAVFEKVFPDERRTAEDTPFFRTVELPPSKRNGPDIERELLKSGVRVCHSCRFAAHKNPARSFLRISLSSVSSKEALKEALKTVKRYVRLTVR